MGATREKKVYMQLSGHSPYKILTAHQDVQVSFLKWYTRGSGQWCFHTKMIHQKPNGKMTFSVLISIGLNINKLPYKINMKSVSPGVSEV